MDCRSPRISVSLRPERKNDKSIDNLKSAQSIFGDKFDAFQAAQADQDKREAIRKEAVAAYAKCHDLAVYLIQDYGWPAVEIAAE